MNEPDTLKSKAVYYFVCGFSWVIGWSLALAIVIPTAVYILSD